MTPKSPLLLGLGDGGCNAISRVTGKDFQTAARQGSAGVTGGGAGVRTGVRQGSDRGQTGVKTGVSRQRQGSSPLLAFNVTRGHQPGQA